MLAAILNMPKTQEDWNRWSFDHRVSHDAIRAGITAQFNIDLTDYQLDPIAPNDVVGFLERNSQMHIDMNTVLNLITTDLEDANFNDKNQLQAWLWLHYQEHFNAENKLGIAS